MTVPVPGELYRISLRGTGHELSGPHYAVVVSDEAFNDLSTVVVVPFSTGARRYSWRVGVHIHGKVSLALTDQVRAVDKSLLRELIGMVEPGALWQIRHFIAEIVGIV